MKQWGMLVAIVLIVFVLSRCGKESEPTPGTFAHVYKTFRTSNCQECHHPTGAATTDNKVTFDMTSQDTAFTTLTTGKSSSTSSTLCNGASLVVAGNVANSYLAGILFTEYAKNNFAGKANCLPPFNSHSQFINLKPEEKTSIETWINSLPKSR